MTRETFRTIRVPAWAYDAACQAELAVARRGVRAVPEAVLRPRACPVCRCALDLKGSGRLLCCGRCGQGQPDLRADARPTLGLVVGLGALVLLGIVFGDDAREPERIRRVRARRVRRRRKV